MDSYSDENSKDAFNIYIYKNRRIDYNEYTNLKHIFYTKNLSQLNESTNEK